MPSAKRLMRLRNACPELADLEARAARRIPHFASEFLQGGAGDGRGHLANRAAFDAITLVPRYGTDVRRTDTAVRMFGRDYAAPCGIAPVGLDGMMWPGGTLALAAAAQRLRLPYIVGMLASAPIEEVMAIAPDVTWMQLYPMAADDHALTKRMMARAAAAGVRQLVVTLDVPVRAKRPRDRRARLAAPFTLSPATAFHAAIRPAWLAALARHGMPQFANIKGLTGAAQINAQSAFVQRAVGGGFTWEALARLRDHWPGDLLVKGILHPADAEAALALGVAGIVVSNHGGRQSEIAPAAIDVLPAIARQVAGRAAVLFDSGIRTGADVAKAVACGADLALSGRGFITAMAALGDCGAGIYGEALIEELTLTLGQCGLSDCAALRSAPLRHAAAWSAADFAKTGLQAP